MAEAEAALGAWWIAPVEAVVEHASHTVASISSRVQGANSGASSGANSRSRAEGNRTQPEEDAQSEKCWWRGHHHRDSRRNEPRQWRRQRR